MIYSDEVTRSIIPNDYYIVKFNHLYRCEYNDFTFYVGTNIERMDDTILIEAFINEYQILKPYFRKTVELTAIEIKKYFNDELISDLDALNISKLYINNKKIINTMIKEYREIVLIN